jgi:hypothetical protein
LSPLADAEGPEGLIEEYLDRVCARLVDDVPRERRLELRAELKAHLEALVDAHQEIGASPQEAIAAALVQFGDAAVVGREWARSWKGQGRRPGREALRATMAALLTFGIANSLSLVLLMMAQSGGWRDGLLWGGLFPTVAFLLPALAGLATGLVVRGEAARASVIALLLILPTMTVALPHLLQKGIDSPGRISMLPFDDLLMIGWLRALFWVPIGCWAAEVSERLRSGRERRADGRLTVS